MKSKKANTALFILVATLVNIVIMILLFVLGLYLISVLTDPESTMVPLWLGLVFVGSMGGSFFIYSLLMKLISKKFNLEDHLDPIFVSKKNRRNPMD